MGVQPRTWSRKVVGIGIAAALGVLAIISVWWTSSPPSPRLVLPFEAVVDQPPPPDSEDLTEPPQLPQLGKSDEMVRIDGRELLAVSDDQPVPEFEPGQTVRLEIAVTIFDPRENGGLKEDGTQPAPKIRFMLHALPNRVDGKARHPFHFDTLGLFIDSHNHLTVTPKGWRLEEDFGEVRLPKEPNTYILQLQVADHLAMRRPGPIMTQFAVERTFRIVEPSSVRRGD